MAVIISAEVLSKEIWLIKLLIKNNEIALAINKINKINSFFSSNTFLSKMKYSLILLYQIFVFFIRDKVSFYSYPR